MTLSPGRSWGPSKARDVSTCQHIVIQHLNPFVGIFVLLREREWGQVPDGGEDEGGPTKVGPRLNWLSQTDDNLTVAHNSLNRRTLSTCVLQIVAM